MSTAAAPAPRNSPASGASPTRCASCRACSRAGPPARRSGLLVENEDQRSRDYEKIKDRFRPGHADYTYQQKYGFRDYRGGGRSSARETVMRVAAGAIARKYLRERLRRQHPRLSGADGPDRARAGRSVRAPMRIRSSVPIRAASQELEEFIWRMREAGDSIGARVTVDRAGRAARAGRAGVRAARCRSGERHDGHQRREGRGDRRRLRVASSSAAREHRDELTPQGFKSNHAGGVLGGISSGQDIVVSIALKPTSSITRAGRDHRCSRQCRRDRDHRTSRSLRRHARDADRRGHAGAGADGSLSAASARSAPTWCAPRRSSRRAP